MRLASKPSEVVSSHAQPVLDGTMRAGTYSMKIRSRNLSVAFRGIAQCTVFRPKAGQSLRDIDFVHGSETSRWGLIAAKEVHRATTKLVTSLFLLLAFCTVASA